MNASIGTRADERASAEAILNSGQDSTLLKLLREETTLVILMVRIEVQTRREAWEAEQADIEWEEN